MTDLVLVGAACLMVGAVFGLGIAYLMGAGARADEIARNDYLEGECARLRSVLGKVMDRVDATYKQGRSDALEDLGVRMDAERKWKP